MNVFEVRRLPCLIEAHFLPCLFSCSDTTFSCQGAFAQAVGSTSCFPVWSFFLPLGAIVFLLAQRFYHILGLYERVHAVCARKCLVQPQGYKRTLCDKSQLFRPQSCHFLCFALLCTSACCVLQVRNFASLYKLGQESGWRKSLVK